MSVTFLKDKIAHTFDSKIQTCPSGKVLLLAWLETSCLRGVNALGKVIMYFHTCLHSYGE